MSKLYSSNKDFISKLVDLGHYAISIENKAAIGCPTVQSWQLENEDDILRIDKKIKEVQRIKSATRFQKEIENRCFDPELLQVGLYTLTSNIFVIDVDTKNHHDTNFGRSFLNELKIHFPEIEKKLYIEQTPSKGFHIISWTKEKDENEYDSFYTAYAVNKNTSSEDKKKYISTIEFRTGEKLYLNVIYPSKGYEVIQNSLFNLDYISIEEKRKLYEFTKEFDERQNYLCKCVDNKKVKQTKQERALSLKEQGEFSMSLIIIDTYPLLSKQSALEVSSILLLKSKNWCDIKITKKDLIDFIFTEINRKGRSISRSRIDQAIRNLIKYNLLRETKKDEVYHLCSFENIIKHYKKEIERKEKTTNFYEKLSPKRRIYFNTKDSFNPSVLNVFAISRRIDNCIISEVNRKNSNVNKRNVKREDISSFIATDKNYYGRTHQESLAKHFSTSQQNISKIIQEGKQYNLLQSFELSGVYSKEKAESMKGFKWETKSKTVFVKETNGYIFNLESCKNSIVNISTNLLLRNHAQKKRKGNYQSMYFNIEYFSKITGEKVGEEVIRKSRRLDSQSNYFISIISKKQIKGKENYASVETEFSREEFLLRRMNGEFDESKLMGKEELKKYLWRRKNNISSERVQLKQNM